jgi:hypothetical protein
LPTFGLPISDDPEPAFGLGDLQAHRRRGLGTVTAEREGIQMLDKQLKDLFGFVSILVGRHAEFFDGPMHQIAELVRRQFTRCVVERSQPEHMAKVKSVGARQVITKRRDA